MPRETRLLRQAAEWRWLPLGFGDIPRHPIGDNKLPQQWQPNANHANLRNPSSCMHNTHGKQHNWCIKLRIEDKRQLFACTDLITPKSNRIWATSPSEIPPGWWNSFQLPNLPIGWPIYENVGKTSMVSRNSIFGTTFGASEPSQ